MAITNQLICIFMITLLFPAISTAQVPANETFRYVNEGEFGPYITEYDASYRPLPISGSPFQLFFYNTTPSVYYLGLRMATSRSESIRRWVWDANRSRPVGENATLSFSRSGNLVLADADGRVAWQTNTANKGVVGLRLQRNGNLVLYDRSGKFVWQSFDYPTDTILVGQSLLTASRNTLVARASPAEPANGRYRLVLEPGGIALYMTIPRNRRVAYQNYSDGNFMATRPIDSVTFVAEPDTSEGYAYNLQLNLVEAGAAAGSFLLARPKYNATLSFLRIESNGNLRVYTYYDYVDYRAWEVTFTFFSGDGRVTGCRLPERCGALGVCEDEMCVACPSPKGLLGWSSACAPPRPRPCGGGAEYYRVDSVEHFLSAYDQGIGPVSVGQCRDRCTKDCGCVGFFYRQKSSKCSVLPILGTLAKVSNSSHIVYIKIFK